MSEYILLSYADKLEKRELKRILRDGLKEKNDNLPNIDKMNKSDLLNWIVNKQITINEDKYPNPQIKKEKKKKELEEEAQTYKIDELIIFNHDGLKEFDIHNYNNKLPQDYNKSGDYLFGKIKEIKKQKMMIQLVQTECYREYENGSGEYLGTNYTTNNNILEQIVSIPIQRIRKVVNNQYYDESRYF